jgi:hypothetical protein
MIASICSLSTAEKSSKAIGLPVLEGLAIVVASGAELEESV